MKNTDVAILELELRQFMVNSIIDEPELNPNNVKLHMQYRLEWLAHQLTAVLSLPSKVLQDNREIARFPANKIDNFLVSVGLARYASFKVLRANEFVTFPQFSFPRGEKFRIVYKTELAAF